MTDHDPKQHRPDGGNLPLILSAEQQQKVEEEAREKRERAAEIEAAQAHRERDEAFKERQLELMGSSNKQTAAYVRLTRAIVGLSLVGLIATIIGLFATFRQGSIAKGSADSAKVSADAATSAANTAAATLKEMQTGQGAQDTHTLAQAAQTQAEASKTSANAAQSAANTAKATLEVQSSPWLGIEKDEAEFDPPQFFQTNGSIVLTFKIRLHNYGSAPALDVNVYIPARATGGKYAGPEFFRGQNACTEPEQAARDVEVRKFYGVEHIVWPSDDRDFQQTINATTSPVSYIPGCISYRGRSGGFQHVSFLYAINKPIDPADQTPEIPKIHDVTLVGLEPQQ